MVHYIITIVLLFVVNEDDAIAVVALISFFLYVFSYQFCNGGGTVVQIPVTGPWACVFIHSPTFTKYSCVPFYILAFFFFF